MREPIQRCFQVGIVAFMAYPGLLRGESPDTLESIRTLACDDYFDAIEVTWLKDGAMRRQAAELLKSAHVTVCYGAQPRLLTTGLNPNATDEGERQKAEDTLREAVDEAAELGAKGISFLSGKWAKATREQNYSSLLKTTGALCRYAGSKGMDVELEVFDYDIAKAALIGPAPLAARFAAEVRRSYPNFGLLVDLSHIPMCREEIGFTVSTLSPYITHLHIGNTVCANPALEGYGDEHQRFGFPGGANDTPQVLEFLRVLKREGFFRTENPYVLSFEVKPWKGEEPETVIAGAKRVLNRAWALLED